MTVQSNKTSSEQPKRLRQTMQLKLAIPQKQLSTTSRKLLNTRRAAAERWKPKLTRPFPTSKEIKEAYDGKLLRHYTDSSSSASVVPNPIKPHINKSARVENLLKQFPLLNISSAPEEPSSSPTAQPSPSPFAPAALEQFHKNQEALLQTNKTITRSEGAQWLAWECFSRPEKGRLDRGREAMMISGLWDDDLIKEAHGKPNDLPEWRKSNTSRYAKEDESWP